MRLTVELEDKFKPDEHGDSAEVVLVHVVGFEHGSNPKSLVNFVHSLVEPHLRGDVVLDDFNVAL